MAGDELVGTDQIKAAWNSRYGWTRVGGKVECGMVKQEGKRTDIYGFQGFSSEWQE